MSEHQNSGSEKQRRVRPHVRRLKEENRVLLQTALTQCADRLQRPAETSLDKQIQQNLIARNAAINTLLTLGSIPDMESVRRNLPEDAGEISDDILLSGISNASRINMNAVGEPMPTLAMFLDLSNEP